MNPFLIAAIAVLGTLSFFFLIYLFMIAPSRRGMKKVRELSAYSFAHRGLHSEAVAENSLTAFRLAVEKGYGIELDVRLSKDGRLVVFHDDTLERVTEGEGRVDSFDYAELSKLHLCATEDRIPLFEDVLKLVDGRVPLLVEIKEDAHKYGVTEKTVELLRGYKGDYLIESFNPLALGRVKKLMPSAPRGILCMNYLSKEVFRAPTYFLLQNFLLNAVCRPSFIAYNLNDRKDAPFRFLRFLFSVPSFAWTVRSEKEEQEAHSSGFSGVIFENYG